MDLRNHSYSSDIWFRLTPSFPVLIAFWVKQDQSIK